jgi:hypothetical protein
MYGVSKNIMTLWSEIVRKKNCFKKPNLQWLITLNWIEKQVVFVCVFVCVCVCLCVCVFGEISLIQDRLK